MGLGLWMLYWREKFCGAIVERGCHVVRSTTSTPAAR
jgi:hypothetical protein